MGIVLGLLGRADDVLVLCYHAVSERWPAALSVTPERLREQLELLVRRGYRGVTFDEAVTSPHRGRVVAVTFDDAFRSVHELAYPILSALGIPGTVFVVTDFAERDDPLSWPGIEQWADTPHASELGGMTWSQLEALVAAGWEIGSHTRAHPRLTQLDDESLDGELRSSRAACERALGRPCRSLAYPYGDHDTRVVEATRRAGYVSAATLPGRPTPPAALEWPRVGIYNRDGRARFRLKVSPAVRRLRRTR